MNASLEDVCSVRGWNIAGSIGSTGKDSRGISADVNDYLMAAGDFTARSTISPRPPVNVDGPISPENIPSLKSTDPISYVTNKFVGYAMETA
jgi:hypothetical protein